MKGRTQKGFIEPGQPKENPSSSQIRIRIQKNCPDPERSGTHIHRAKRVDYRNNEFNSNYALPLSPDPDPTPVSQQSAHSRKKISYI